MTIVHLFLDLKKKQELKEPILSLGESEIALYQFPV